MSENNPITVFATHAFDESDDYLRVFEFLESVDRFYYINVSKPENVPAAGGMQAIKDELIVQVKTSEAVLVLSSAYAQHPEITKFTMEIAKANNIAMISVSPFGGVAETPDELLERCDGHVGWNDREIADALLFLARGKDTQRWEVLDFPGFDADGPTD